MKSSSQFIVLLIIALSSFSFFKPSFIEKDSSIYIYIYTSLILFLIPHILKGIFFKRKLHLKRPLKLIGISIIVSIFYSNIHWGQPIQYSILASVFPVGGYFIYFYLIDKKVPIHIVEKVIIWIGLCFICIFLLSFLIYPYQIFYYTESIASRGFHRIFINGDGFLFLFFFLSINKYVFTNKKRWVLFSLLAFICILLNQSRVYIISCLLITLIYILKHKNVRLKIFIVVCVLLSYFILPQLDFYKQLYSTTETELADVKEYVRFSAGEYFLTEFNPSMYSHIFGNGFGYGSKTKFGEIILDLGETNGFYIEDLGFIGLYVHLGVLALLGFIGIFYKGLKLRLRADIVYLKMFLIFLILTGLTTSVSFNYNFIIPIVFSFYLLEKGVVE